MRTTSNNDVNTKEVRRNKVFRLLTLENILDYCNFPLNLGLVKEVKVNFKVPFNLFSLLQLTDNIKLTFSKIWQCRNNFDNTAQLKNFFFNSVPRTGFVFFLYAHFVYI